MALSQRSGISFSKKEIGTRKHGWLEVYQAQCLEQKGLRPTYRCMYDTVGVLSAGMEQVKERALLSCMADMESCAQGWGVLTENTHTREFRLHQQQPQISLYWTTNLWSQRTIRASENTAWKGEMPPRVHSSCSRVKRTQLQTPPLRILWPYILLWLCDFQLSHPSSEDGKNNHFKESQKALIRIAEYNARV